MSSGDSTTVTIAVAVIGAAGTAFSAWLYSRRDEHPPEHRTHQRIKDGVMLDVQSDPTLDIETITHLSKRIARLERWKRHAIPVLLRVANMLEWDDPELLGRIDGRDEEDEG